MAARRARKISNAQLFEAAALGFSADLFGDMHPGQGRARQNMGQSGMDGVVRADDEIGARALERLDRPQHDLRHALPVFVLRKVLHIFGESDGVQRDFRVRMLAH